MTGSARGACGRIIALLIAAVMVFWCRPDGEALAAGTPAGTRINNDATVSFTMYGVSQVLKSNTSTLKVDDKVVFTLASTDVADVTITPGGTAGMSYLLTNSGNASHDFTLNAAVTGTPGFTPAAQPLFFADAAGTIPLPVDPNAGGLPYISNLAPDTSKTVYLFITAPPALADGQTLHYVITAESYQPSHLGGVNPPLKSSLKAATDAPADKNANLTSQYVVLADHFGNGGDLFRDGKFATIANDGNGAAIGFKAKTAALSIVKAQAVADINGGSQPYSGSTIRYTLTASVSGSGSALGVLITDPFPANTTYIPGTLTLNGAPLTDGVDADAGDAGVTLPGVISVKLGDMTSATPPQVISFAVKID
jgi:uncharacterized repeat protein (TIGR01451 family)